MILLRDVCLSFGLQPIFDNLSLSFGERQRVGLVGRNGAGKSTLLKVIAGLQGLDSGSVDIQKGVRIAYLPQEAVITSDKNVLDEALTAFGEVYDLLQESHRLEVLLEKEDVDPDTVERYGDVQNALIEAGAGDLNAEAKKVLTGLGFTSERMEQRVAQLSVGWRMRLLLAKLLLSKPDVYLFDEPTNHLDIVAKDWFLEYIKESSSGFVLVSHDRYFLDHLCDQILELESGVGTFYQGNYTSYLERSAAEKELLEQRYAQQQKELKQKMAIIERFKAKASKAKMAQSMLKKVEKVERISLRSSRKKVAFSFGEVKRSGKVVLTVDNVNVSYGDTKILSNISLEVARGERVALVAANGVGKTTLFKTITGSLTPTSGHITFGHNVETALFEQNQEDVLDMKKTIIDEVEDSCTTSEARGRVRSMLGAFLFPGDDVRKKIGVLSGGEKNRVAMVKVLLEGANFLLLDEPTNHLDIESKEVLLQALKQFTGTILFVSHDRDFLERLATHIVELTPTKAFSYPGNYKSYVYQKGRQTNELVTQKPKQTRHKKTSKKMNHEQRKKMRSLESRIEKLEKQINKKNEEFGLCVYGSDDYERTRLKLRQLQQDLKEASTEWENLYENS